MLEPSPVFGNTSPSQLKKENILKFKEELINLFSGFELSSFIEDSIKITEAGIVVFTKLYDAEKFGRQRKICCTFNPDSKELTVEFFFYENPVGFPDTETNCVETTQKIKFVNLTEEQEAFLKETISLYLKKGTVMLYDLSKSIGKKELVA